VPKETLTLTQTWNVARQGRKEGAEGRKKQKRKERGSAGLGILLFDICFNVSGPKETLALTQILK
jgi:hypothetical protein